MNRDIASARLGFLVACVSACATMVASPAAMAQHHDAESGTVVQAGLVAFSNSGAAAAQPDFLYGLAQLHNFQYEDAAAAFVRAQHADPAFAMAYWGEAMTHNHAIWAQQNLPAARAALAKLAPTPEARAAKAATAREKAYLNTVEILYGDGDKYDRDRRYALAMERLHAAYPDDIDGTCFYALALLGTAHAGRDVPTYMRAAALTEEVFEAHPQHPGAAHYLIHSVDDAAHAPLGLRAARAYSKIAPDSPHALHMTSHIYLALGMWQEMVAANEEAIRVGNRNILAADKSRSLPGCGHARTWLAYGYLQQGRFNDARQLTEACEEEMRNRPYLMRGADLLDYDGSSIGSFSVMRARYLIDSGEWTGPMARWKADAAVVPAAEYARDFAEAYGAVRYGKVETAAAAMTRVDASAQRVLAAAVDAGIPAQHPMRRIPRVEHDELNGLLLFRRGDKAAAIQLLVTAAQAERELPMDFGPPSLLKPANELLGELLIEQGRAAEARTAFDAAQIIAPGRTQSLLGLARAAQALGDKELADSVNAKLSAIARDAERR